MHGRRQLNGLVMDLHQIADGLHQTSHKAAQGVRKCLGLRHDEPLTEEHFKRLLRLLDGDQGLTESAFIMWGLLEREGHARR